MNQTDYILRSLSKISHKRWEHYVINRIYHRLNDQEIEFVCQQCIRKNDEKIYIADLFLPQLGLYLEVDEGHHSKDVAILKDAVRRLDITDATGLIEERMPVSNRSLDMINDSIEDFVVKIRKRKDELLQDSLFETWDYGQRFKPQIHLDRGFIEVGPHSAFLSQKDALSCFGYGKGHYQRGVWTLPQDACDYLGLSGRVVVWFPRLSEQTNWVNSLSDDGRTIIEISKRDEHSYEEFTSYRIVMGRSRDPLNRTLYRFLGLFQVIPEYRVGREHRFAIVDTRLKTVSAATFHSRP